MDYISWSNEYLEEAEKIYAVIEKKKKILPHATADNKKILNEDIIKLRSIYRECIEISRILSERAKSNAA